MTLNADNKFPTPLKTPGLRFRKLDLHVHTPASGDVKVEYTPEQIVAQAVKVGLSAVAICDHHTGSRVDSVKNAAKGTGLVVFPGVEIKATGGEKGVHVICLFDVDKTSNDILQFLNRLKIYDKDGSPTPVTELAAGTIAAELQEYDPKAILVLAHCHSTKGVLGDMKGETRKAVFNPQRICLLGAETSAGNFQDLDKAKDRKRVIDVLDGSDPNFHYRKLGVYQSSDAHTLDAVGSAYSWFKVDEAITIEDLRQCLIDRDTRIRQPHEYTQQVYPLIRALRIQDGFLAEQALALNAGLNSILGGKGTGKSLVVEFLRFALAQQPSDPTLRRDHDEKLMKCLRHYGKVDVEIVDESGHAYRITRTYNPPSGSPTTILDLAENSQKEFEIERTFPVLFLSQNEVIRIAEDQSGEAQRAFIDKFFDFTSYQHAISELSQELLESDRRFAETVKAHISLAALLKERATLAEEIAKIDRQLKDPTFAKYSKKEKIGRAIGSYRAFLASLVSTLAAAKSEIPIKPDVQLDDGIADEPTVLRTRDIATDAAEKVLERVNEAIGITTECDAKIAHEVKVWEADFDVVKQEYEATVKAAGGSHVILSQRRGKLSGQLTELDKRIAAVKSKAETLSAVADKRSSILVKLDGVRRKYFLARQTRCQQFTSSSAGTLEVSVQESSDTSAFEQNLKALKRGTWLKDDEVQAIARSVQPKDFVRCVMGFEFKGRQAADLVNQVATATGMAAEKVERLFVHLLDTCEYENILALVYTSMPKDMPQIRYRVGNTYKPLHELSVGQKAVALLIMALGDGTFPIVIDQPEDSLDLRTIWQDVCQKVRGAKDHRQFVFTTHNSSVAVASDSDSFTILESSAPNGSVLFTGSLNQAPIKEEVIKYLEGGRATYAQKRMKYGLDEREGSN